jgi:hypothetical protein
MSTSKKNKAGRASGIKRAKMCRVRRFWVLSAFEKLKPTHQKQPYSSESINALEEEFRNPSLGQDPLPQLDPPLGEYESVLDPSWPVPSEKLMRMMFEMRDDLDVDLSTMQSIRRASRETLIRDLKALGVRSKR